MKSFECYYAMYLNHKGLKSRISGENIIDAIKKRNQNAILVKIFDEDGTEYFVKEHKKASPNKYFDYYWVDKDNNILFDEREEKWGDYYKQKKLDKQRRKEIKNKKPIVKDDLKVKIFAYNNFLIFDTYKPYEDIGNDWYPVNDKGHIGSTIDFTEKNLGVSLEALKLMEKIKRCSDSIGDISWSISNGRHVLSWIGSLYRIMDVNDSVAARDFRILKDKCVLIENIISDEMINNISENMWKQPFYVSDNGIKKYNRNLKLDKLNSI